MIFIKIFDKIYIEKIKGVSIMFEFTEQDYKAFKVVAQQTQEQLSRTSRLILEKYYEKDKSLLH